MALNERSCYKPQSRGSIRRHFALVPFPIRVFARHFGSSSFCLSTRARTEEIELVAEGIFRYKFSGTSRLLKAPFKSLLSALRRKRQKCYFATSDSQAHFAPKYSDRFARSGFLPNITPISGWFWKFVRAFSARFAVRSTLRIYKNDAQPSAFRAACQPINSCAAHD